MEYQRIAISSDIIEKRILTGMIISDSYLRDISLMIKPNFFKIDYCKKIVKWILEYYKEYKKAPQRDFESIFYAKSEKLKSAEIEIMEEFLQELSDQYISNSQESFPFNIELLFNDTVSFCRDRQLEILYKTVEGYRIEGDFTRAEELITNFGKVAQQTSQWFNPLDQEEIYKTFEEDSRNKLCKLPGALGDLIGYLERGWLVGILGPTKRGKCISGDSLVSLANGSTISIRELVKKGKKEEIISFNEETQRFEPVKITELFDNGIKECFQIETRTRRRVSTTINHQYLTPDGWRYLKDIKIGDYIAVPKKIDFFGDYDMDESLVKFLSYMMAEGGLTGTQPCFTNTDEKINLDFEKCCRDLDIGWKITDVSHYLLGARPLMKKFNLMGHLSKNKLIPEEIMNSSRKTISTFLRIFFTCDGSIYKEKKAKSFKIELQLANEKLINQISSLLLKFGIVHKVYDYPATLNGKKFPAWGIFIESQEYVNLFLKQIGFDSYKYKAEVEDLGQRSFLDCFPLKVAQKIYDELKEECNHGKFRYDGKYACSPTLQAMLKGKSSSISYALNKKQKTFLRKSFSGAETTKTYQKYINSHILWDKIKSITSIGEVDTYDISVPDKHNFIADNCIVHNSFYEWEIAFHLLCNKLKVAIFSFEMGRTTYKKRIYQRMTAMAEKGGQYAYPVFDCAANQNGSCKKTQRTNQASLKTRDGKGWLPYSPDMSYKPCVACRGTKDFYPVTWWQTQNQKEGLNPEDITQKVKTFKKLYGDNLRVRCFPAFSAGFDEAIAELDNLRNQGFNPDAILFDYFDIMAAEVPNELEDENRKWKKGKGLAGERGCLVINCHQGNRDSEEASSIKQKHTGGNVKKLQHLDLDLTLNQTEQEKKKGVMRINILVERSGKGASKGEVVVLQCLDLGQPFIDSEWNKKGPRQNEEDGDK